MSSQLSLVAVNLATAFVESALYGVFVVLFVTSIYFLSQRRKASVTSNDHSTNITPITVASILIFGMVTGHWVCMIYRGVKAFLIYNDGKTPLLYFTNLSEASDVMRVGLIVASGMVCDAMMVYRLWIIWDNNKYIVMFPLLTLTGLIVCGVGITYQLTRFKMGEDIYIYLAGRWVTSDCIFTLCTNIYCTILIVWRIWSINVNAREYGGANLNSLLATIVESAAVFTVWAILFFATYLAKSTLAFFVIDTMPAISGIAFTLINARVGLGWARNSQSCTQRLPWRQSLQFGPIRVRTKSTGPSRLRPLSLNINEEVTVDYCKSTAPGSSRDSVSKGASFFEV